MLRGLITALLVIGSARVALSAEPDTTAAPPSRPRPAASAPT